MYAPSDPAYQWFQQEDGKPTGRRIAGYPVVTDRGGEKRRFFAALHIPPIASPVDSVQAAIVAEQRARPS